MVKVVVVTGASAGIGRACADRLHRSGWTVVGASRRGTSSAGWTPLVIDVDEDISVRDAMARVLDRYGRVDAVIACAGWGVAGPVELTPLSLAKAQLETNFWGAVRIVDAALPTMRQQQSGRIVLMSSIAGRIAVPFQAFYSASKFALEGYGEALAYEVAPFGIDVTLVEPGNIRTDFTASRRKVAPLAGDGPYAAASSRAIETMEHDESNGAPADDVAAVVERVLGASRRPPRRTSVGKIDERLGLVAKRLLPHRLFEKAAHRSLGV